MSDHETKSQADARLAILGELAQLRDATANSNHLMPLIDLMGRRRSREWLESQLMRLEELGAIRLRRVDLPGLGPVSVATLTSTGRDHVDRRSMLAGVTAPADLD
ncbi:MAG: hypothetical protein ABI673_02620 [Novosphingobium sp.]